MTKVSVIVPVYNAEKYLVKCIESLLNQTLQELEFIFVDDGSTDASVSIINEYMEKDGRIQLINQKHSYAGAARNNGMKAASGEYIIFLDSDDFFACDMLEQMYDKAVSDKADVCLCNAIRFDNKTGETDFPGHFLVKDMLPETTPFSAADVKDCIFNLTSPAPWNKLFKTEFILKNKIQFQKTKKTNDLFFVFANLSLASAITYIDKPFVNYRVANESSIQGESNALNLDFNQAVYALKNELQSRKLFVQFEKSFVNRALSLCIFSLFSAGNMQNFKQIAELLRTKCFFDLKIIGHTRSYFYVKDNFDTMIDILQLSDEKLWNKYKIKKEKKECPLINIEAWQPDYDYVSDHSVKISVIIPVFNSENYLADCLESVMNNTFKDIEMICVNDGSTDHSLNILKEFAEKDSRISIINKENGGASMARNAGLEAAVGEYILFIDSDDYIHERTLEYLYCEVKKNNLDQLYFSAVSFYEDADVKKNFIVFDSLYKRSADYSAIISGRKMFVEMVKNGEFRPSPCMQINKKEFLDKYKLRFYDGLIHEDNLFTVQCLAFAERVKYANINLYFRRVHDHSVMTSSSAYTSIYSYYKIIKLLEQFAVQNKLSDDKAYFQALMHQLSVMNFNACDAAESLTDEELAEFAMTLEEDEAIDFYNHINAVVKIRLRNKALFKKAKTNNELAVVRKANMEHIQLENDKLQSKVSRVTEENERLKKKLSIKLVCYALRLNAWLDKLLHGK